MNVRMIGAHLLVALALPAAGLCQQSLPVPGDAAESIASNQTGSTGAASTPPDPRDTAPPAAIAYPWRVVSQGDNVYTILQGSGFPVVLESAVSSKSAQLGDSVYARLAEALHVDGRTIASKGALVSGHIKSVDRSRKVLRSDVPGKHWLNANGALGIEFDELLTDSGQNLDITAIPAPQTKVASVAADKTNVVVDSQGDVTLSFHSGTYGTMSAAIEGASIAAGFAGPIGWAAGPLLSGVAGAMSPSYAFGKPSQDIDGHRRIKGFFMGALKGAPGGFVVTGLKNHGEDVTLAQGDRLTVELTADVVISFGGTSPHPAPSR